MTELLMALAIIGIIATFAIPKILNAQQDAHNKAIAKEALTAVSQAYLKYRYDVGLDTETAVGDLTPYLNYVRVETVDPIDDHYNATTLNCDGGAGWKCVELHNGSKIRFHGSLSFDCSTANCAIHFYLDPDGKVTNGGATTGPGKSIEAWLYYDGLLRTKGTRLSGTCSHGSCGYNPNPADDPPWFSWD